MNNDFSHGGDIHAWRRTNQNADVLDFSANINPLGLADSVRSAIEGALDDIIHYPDPAGHDLKAAIAAYYQVPATTITLGNGAVELLYLYCHLCKPQRVLILAPSFSEYERAARAVNATIDYHYLDSQNGFKIEIDRLSRILDDYDMIFIGNPNNPTGTLIKRLEIEKLLIAAQRTGCRIVLDESFIDFIPDGNDYTCRNMVTQYTGLLIIQSLTKFYALPGLRLGFGLSNAAIAVSLNALKDPWNVNSLAQKAGIAALADYKYQCSTRELVTEQIQYLYAELRKFTALRVYRPSVNFILVNFVGAGLTAAAVQDYFANNAILVRNCDNYPGLDQYYVRFAVRSYAENNQLLTVLNNLMAGVK